MRPLVFSFRSAPALLLAAALLASPSAFAQYDRDSSDRVEKLERDVMTLQRMVARSGGGAVAGAPGGDAEVRLSALEEELRRLRGKVEEVEFQQRKQAETLERFQKDIDLRFEQQRAPSPASPEAAKPTPLSAAEPVDGPVDLSVEAREGRDAPDDASPQKTSAGDGVLKVPGGPGGPDASGRFESPREHYNYAFRLMNQTRYDDAAQYFRSFTTEYPKDPLVGNAYYWLGETQYIRRDYAKAADHFRQGFEVMPSGPKASDNLLKLAMSLSALKRNSDACVVLDQILVKFKDSSVAVAQKAKQERSRIGCK